MDNKDPKFMKNLNHYSQNLFKEKKIAFVSLQELENGEKLGCRHFLNHLKRKKTFLLYKTKE
ncbi:hypothetical protein [Bacillus sp. X1(2014)]|uniref:hypothetical protein n=1 Tax=Bacillus sp. X1(2014) TaxID=1565991 RepID=UPI0011A2F36B|nr:hypothetical protein [Bacillus sp. X1(2014)]